MAKKQTVYLFEDHLIVLEEIKAMLEGYGFELIGASTEWEDALETILLLKPEILLLSTDLSNEAGGVKLARKVKESYDPMLFFLVIETENLSFPEIKLLRPTGYIIKPFNETGLHTTIDLGLAYDAGKKDVPLDAVARFSQRELEVIKYMANGLKAAEVAKAMFVSVNTVKTHKKSIYKKANVSNTAELMVYACTHNML